MPGQGAGSDDSKGSTILSGRYAETCQHTNQLCSGSASISLGVNVTAGQLQAVGFHSLPRRNPTPVDSWSTAGISTETVIVPLSSIRSGESPRSGGEDMTHVARLAAMEGELPPVLVDKRSMRVIDGMHRLRAAVLRGRTTIEVRFFDGSSEDAFLHAVLSNVRHGLPLSQRDCQAAAERIIRSHPHLSDRAIAELAGLSAKTVTGIRRRSAVVPQVSARLGKDGKVRPVSGAEGRRRAARFLADNPNASLREIARGTGISPATARDVRRRLAGGEDPVPARLGATDERRKRLGSAAGSGIQRVMRQTPAFVLDKLLRDPALRYNGQGQRLLRWLQHNPVEPHERSSVIDAVPPHCAAMIVQLAHQIADDWLDLAHQLDERAQILES
jgi:ParB-like chromosome segregation protein Spo0J